MILATCAAFFWGAGCSVAIGARPQERSRQRANLAAAALGAKLMENRLWLSPTGSEQDALIVGSLWIRFRGVCLIDLIRQPYLYQPGDWARSFDPHLFQDHHPAS